MAKKKFSIVRVLVTLVIMVVVAFVVYNNVKNITPPGPTIEKLAPPTEVTFNEYTFTLTWNAVDNATGYAVSYNDNTYQVTETSMHILPTAEQNVFKVKAVGDGVDYSDSDWSQQCIYTITTTTINVFEKVNLQLAKTAQEEGFTLARVVGISYADMKTGLSSENLRFETICNENGVNKNMSIAYTFDGFDSIGDMLQNIDQHTDSSIGVYNIVNYNTAEELLLSNSYDGQMEGLRKLGYEFSVVDSIVRKGSKSGSGFSFSLVATFKAEKDGEVRYFTSVNDIKIRNSSSEESNNYEISVSYTKLRTITERYFVEHTYSTTWEYMQGLVGASDTQN